MLACRNHTVRFCHIVIALAWGAVSMLSAAEQPGASLTVSQAMGVLQKKGLTANGFVWLNAEELKLRQALDAEEVVKRKFYKAEFARWELLQHRLAKLLVEANQMPRDAARQDRLQMLLTQAATECDRLAKLLRLPTPKPNPKAEIAADQLRRAWTASTHAYQALFHAVQTVQTCDDAQLEKSYLPLHKQPEVAEALAAMGTRSKLGPMRKYDPLRREWEKLVPEVEKGTIPLLPADDHYQLIGHLADQVLVTFEYRPDDDLSILSEALALQAGLKLDDQHAQRVRMTLGSRQLDVYRVQVPSLRLGRHLLLNFPAIVLPTDVPHSEPRLGRQAFHAFETDLDFDLLQIHLTPHESSLGHSSPSP